MQKTVLARALSECMIDRKSTRLNSSHLGISYAVFADLHSFPTRRSSDLGGGAGIKIPPVSLFFPDAKDRSSARVIRVHDRSEEHTSELQSLRHLVCRLRRSSLFPYTTLFRSWRGSRHKDSTSLVVFSRCKRPF